MTPDELIVIARTDPLHFEDALGAYFWQTLKEAGGTPLCVEDERFEDEETTLLEHSLAQFVANSFSCAPFKISLYDRDFTYGDSVGIRIEARQYSITCGIVRGTAVFFVDFTWPESWSDGTSGGSHRTDRSTFDTNDPHAIDGIRACVNARCITIIESLRPKPSFNVDLDRPLLCE